MEQQRAMQMSVAGLLAWVGGAALLVAAAGAYPAWSLGGELGVVEQLAAGIVVLAAMLACGVAVLVEARRGAKYAAVTFIAGGLAAGVLALAGAAAIAAWTRMHALSLVLWVGVFFFPMILAESLWLSRALRRDVGRRQS